MPNLRDKIWTTTTPATVGDAQWWEDHLIANEDMEKLRSAVQSVNDVVADEDGNVEISTVPPGGLKNLSIWRKRWQILLHFSCI